MASDRITFYYNPMSRGRTAHWMLEEVGADYEVRLLDWAKQDHKRPDYLALNPMGKIPTIVHKGVVVTETAAICAYLADAFPAAKLAPPVSSAERGAYYRWLFFAASCLEPAVTDLHAPRTSAPPASHAGHGTWNDVKKTLEKAIEPGFVLGREFSTADLYLASCLGWYLSQKMIEPHAGFEAYVKRATDRPAFRRFTEKAPMKG